MRRLAAAVCLFLFSGTAFAHRIDEYLQATILTLQTNQMQASMRLIPGVLVSGSIIAAIDLNGDGLFSDSEQKAYAQRVLGDLSLSIDGQTIQPSLTSWSFPRPSELREGLGEIHIDYTAQLPPGGSSRALILTNHYLAERSVYLVNALVPESPALNIVAQRRNPQQSIYELDYQQTGAAPRSLWANARTELEGVQFSRLFHLGMRHIAEGTDHLLFLLTLLLPAPLLVLGRRWGPPATVRHSVMHILGIVTAFTIGHSITLTLAALGAVHVLSRPVEALIAVSIFVSAIHALRPIVPGKEALIAGFFGLIHGLAFAATLDRLGFGRWERVGGILAFNLGIESMQMIVVAAILPSLLLLSRTRAYSILRVGGGVFAGVASLAWMIERILGIDTPVDTVVNAFARHAVVFAVALLFVSLICRIVLGRSFTPS